MIKLLPYGNLLAYIVIASSEAKVCQYIGCSALITLANLRQPLWTLALEAASPPHRLPLGILDNLLLAGQLYGLKPQVLDVQRQINLRLRAGPKPLQKKKLVN